MLSSYERSDQFTITKRTEARYAHDETLDSRRHSSDSNGSTVLTTATQIYGSRGGASVSRRYNTQLLRWYSSRGYAASTAAPLSR